MATLLRTPRPGDIVTPGIRLGSADAFRAGAGVYISGGVLFATVAGVLSLANGSSSLSTDVAAPLGPGDHRPTIAVTRLDDVRVSRDAGILDDQNRSGIITSHAAPRTLPEIGALVTARVVKITPRAAHTEILLCDGVPMKELFKGTVRQQDVRQTEIDKVEIYRCFRPGDAVLAQVISLGDRHSYFLSTAKNDLGVIHALGPAGEPMVPISWEEMQCPRTKAKEFRKVAKITT